MSDTEQDLVQLIGKVKQTGYENGWQDAVGKMQTALAAFFEEFSAANGGATDTDAEPKRAADGG